MLLAILVAGGLLLALAAAEIWARLALGLGNPPLWRADPEIEYLPLPSRRYVRFGNVVAFNAWSMRSRDFPQRKVDPLELRVLVVGDSIVNGGAYTDQTALATTILEGALAAELRRPVVVGNVSAGSWGPPNQLAYLRRFGLFDADVVVLVLNSPDYADAPQFRPLGPYMPVRPPLVALSELWLKYLDRYLKKRAAAGQPRDVRPEDVRACLAGLRQMVGLARAGGAAVVLAQYLKQEEIEGAPEEGHRAIGAVAAELGIVPVQLGCAFREALRAGRRPYRDGYHPGDEGQRVLAEALLGPVLEAVGEHGSASLTHGTP